MKTRKINVKTGGLFTKKHLSSETNRLIYEDVDGNFHLVKAGEELNTGIFGKTVMNLFTFDLGTDIFDFDFSGQITSKDGIKLSGAVNLTVRLIKDDDKILRMFFDEKTETELLRIAVLHYVQKFTNTIEAVKMKGNIAALTEFLYKSKSGVSELNDCCYEIISFTIKNLDLQDKELNELLNKTVKEKAKEEHTKELTIIKLEQADKEQEYKIKETKGKLDLETTIEKHKNDLVISKAETDLVVERKKFQLDNTKRVVDRLHKIKEADIFKNKEGQMAFFPQEIFKLLEQENELLLLKENDRQKIIQTAFSQLHNSNQSFQAGQLIAVKKVLENFFNFNFGDFSEVQQGTQTIDTALNALQDKKAEPNKEQPQDPPKE